MGKPLNTDPWFIWVPALSGNDITQIRLPDRVVLADLKNERARVVILVCRVLRLGIVDNELISGRTLKVMQRKGPYELALSGLNTIEITTITARPNMEVSITLLA
ncbi:MAG TPA: hypothetical protein VFY96_17180 [Candidatus Binatia bacterium]|nr:hypothetical protein [Candidatus Binatia bacterium]